MKNTTNQTIDELLQSIIAELKSMAPAAVLATR